MRLERVFGLAGMSRGYLTRSFGELAAAGGVRMSGSGAVFSAHACMPASPHFSPGVPTRPPGQGRGGFVSFDYETFQQMLVQQQEFQRQQQDFQRQQQEVNRDQAGLIKEVLANMNTSFSKMMDLMIKLISDQMEETSDSSGRGSSFFASSGSREDAARPANDPIQVRVDHASGKIIRIQGKS